MGAPKELCSSMSIPRMFRHGLLLPLALATAVAAAPPAMPQTGLAPVTVTATRTAQAPFDVAASVDVVAAPDSGSLDVNTSELLQGVPGILARDRQNYAQDEQVSIRGFGARTTFGIRGVRLYSDGIPATMPDGQGQVSHFNLDAADRIEVLRGPFSTLYGNASGGVVQLFSAEGSDPPQVRLGLAGGSDGMWRASLNARGVRGPLDYNLDFSHFRTDGYRDHSRARRESGNAVLGWKPDERHKLTVVLNTMNLPAAQDPLGLTPAQFHDNPRQADEAATTFNTRKSVSQQQAGLIYDDQLTDASHLRLMGYYGQRSVLQYLSIPAVAQLGPLSAGGVVDLDNEYGGGDARWTWAGTLAGQPVELTVGASYDSQHQHRRGYENFIDDTPGVRGALRRDEQDRVHDLDQYTQASWRVADAWTVMAGLRHSAVKFATADRYVTAGNPDDSGRVDYSATTPVAGVMYRVSPTAHLYASYGKGFETPTFSELGYRNDGGSGLNFGLRPSRTRSAEAGLKLRPRPGMRADIALFRADSRDEVAVATNLGGRTTYQNIPRARRQGAEASLTTSLAPRWKLQLAYTWLDARFRSPFLACAGRCAAPDTPVGAGARIAGVPRANGYAALHFGGDTGWRADLDGRYMAAVPTDDLDTVQAPPHAVFGAGTGYVTERGHWRMHAFARIDNLADRRYVGSVIVNDGNGRYFEPGPGRSFLLGVDLRWQP